MKRLILNNIRPGDIIFTARPEKVSKLIRVFTGGIVSHAIICVQHGSFIDSTSDGVRASNIKRELFDDDEQVFHFRLKNQVTPDIMAKIIDFARAEIGVRYSKKEAVRSLVAWKKPRSKQQFCSRLVARVFRKAGIDLVPDADYCTPEDLRLSSLLTEIEVKMEVVEKQEIDWLKTQNNFVQDYHDAQDMILGVARSFDPNVESFNDIFTTLLVHKPGADQAIANALQGSGYLDLWQLEKNAFPWKCNHALIETMTSSEEIDGLREYCISVVKEAYSGGRRFAGNLVQLKTLETLYPRTSFRLKIELYENLVENDQIRREVAYSWLYKHYPDELKLYMEKIEPHSALWYQIVEQVEPKLAILSRHAVRAEGSVEVCSTCGDPATNYRLVNGDAAMPGVPSLRLCDDCIQIRRDMGDELEPFLH